MAVFYPDIWTDTVNTELENTLGVVSRIADDFTNLVPEVNFYGEVLHFPTFDRIGKAEEMIVGTGLTPDRIKQTDNTAKIKHVGKAVTIYDKELVGIKGNAYTAHARQVADAIAVKLEEDLMDEMKTNAVFVSPTTDAAALHAPDLETALMNFGDRRNIQDFAGIVVNSRLVGSVNALTGFTDLNSTTVNIMAAKENGIIMNNLIGLWNGIPIYLSDTGTYDTSTSECVTYIVKNRSIGKIIQRDVNAEDQRDALKKCTHIASDIFYAVKLMNERGVVVMRKTVI